MLGTTNDQRNEQCAHVHAVRLPTSSLRLHPRCLRRDRFTLIRQELTLASARRLQVTDLVLGIAAGLLLVIGLLRVFFFEKGPEYYWHSHAFLTKFALFIIIGLLSIIPTMEFLSWRGAITAGQVPAMDAAKRKRVTMVIHAELAAIVVILFCAAIMARGGWV
jgi:putative membrane protein